MAPSVCDSCKRRKVKCDLTDPCSNCRVSKLHCQYTIVPNKRGRKRRRVRPQGTLKEPVDLEGQDCSSRESVRSFPANATSTHSSLCTPSLIPEDSVLGLASSLSEPERVFYDLVAHIASISPDDDIAAIVQRSIDLFIQYMFPTCPVIHESTYRSIVGRFFTEGHSALTCLSLPPPKFTELSHKKEFALITGLCAAVASTMSEPLMPHQHPLTRAFLNASRAMLHLYCDYDVEYPDSSSLLIRLWHSSGLQNSTGKAGAAWHSLGEATLLAQKLRLYEESTFTRYLPIESQTLRAIFWQLFSSDKSAASFEDRPVVLHPSLFCHDVTVQHLEPQNVRLLDIYQDQGHPGFEDRLLAGFNFKCRVWTLGENLIHQIKFYSQQKTTGSSNIKAEMERLTATYLRFTGLLDDIPQWLQSFEDDSSSSATALPDQHRTSFWIQRSNIIASYHCLELLALQRCIEYGTLKDMGLSDKPLPISIRKLEIARNFVGELHLAPFVCLKVQGEASVGNLRPSPL